MASNNAFNFDPYSSSNQRRTGGPQINVHTGGGPASVSIFLPAVDDIQPDTLEGDVA